MTPIEAEVQVRAMTAEDFDSILAVDRRISMEQRAPTYQDSFNEVFGGDLDTSFVAELDGQVIGFVLAMITSVPGEIMQVCLVQVIGVDANYRNQGVGKRLIQMVCEESRSRGIKTAHVMIDRDDKQMQRLWESVGFHPCHLVDYCKSID